jgi:hypothetical protein
MSIKISVSARQFIKNITKRALLTILLVVGTLPAISHGSLISKDYLTSGDGLLTHDLITGYDWLDLTETLEWGISGNSVMSSKWILNEGFRLATTSEVKALYRSAGIEAPDARYNEGTNPDIDQFMQMLGVTYESQIDFTTVRSNGLSVNDNWPNRVDVNLVGIISKFQLINEGNPVYFSGHSTWSGYGLDFNDGYASFSQGFGGIGAYLVRNSPTDIPEPSGVAIFSMGLLIISLGKLKSKSWLNKILLR